MMRPAILALLLAASATPSAADCGLVAFGIAQPIVERFMFRPETLLRDYPRGGDSMRDVVAVIGMSSRASLPQIIRIAKAAGAEQRQAIGAGLAIAARRCEPSQPATARAIETAVRSFPDVAMAREFAANFRSHQAIQAEQDAGRRARFVREQLTSKPAESVGSGLSKLGVQPIAPIGPLRSLAPPLPTR